MNAQTKAILAQVERWPEEDQQELAEMAREIEARRTGVYTLDEDEQRAIADALQGELVPEDAMAAFWQRHSIP